MSTAVSRIKEKAHSVLRFLAVEALELDAWCLRFFSVAPASSRSSSSKSPSKSDMVEKVRMRISMLYESVSTVLLCIYEDPLKEGSVSVGVICFMWKALHCTVTSSLVL